jgi:hypothetical protein
VAFLSARKVQWSTLVLSSQQAFRRANQAPSDSTLLSANSKISEMIVKSVISSHVELLQESLLRSGHPLEVCCSHWKKALHFGRRH